MVVIQPGHEVDHPPTFNADIKNELSYTSTSWHGQGQLHLYLVPVMFLDGTDPGLPPPFQAEASTLKRF
jgi:hypothetical protein